MLTPDSFFEGLEAWKPELERLRKMILDCHLTEEIKWGTPVYTFNGANIAGIRGFKEYFAIWFYNGVFLSDPHTLLVSAADKTKALRQLRIASMEELEALKGIIPEYLREAVEVEKAGMKIVPDRNKALELPVELRSVLDSDPPLAEAFRSLTPGRQKEYAEYVAEAKQAATREKRVEKCIPMIRNRIGLNDKYRNC